MKKIMLLLMPFVFLACQSYSQNSKSKKADCKIEVIKKTDAEWKKQLSQEQFYVSRKAGTERAFSGVYWDNHDSNT